MLASCLRRRERFNDLGMRMKRGKKPDLVWLVSERLGTQFVPVTGSSCRACRAPRCVAMVVAPALVSISISTHPITLSRIMKKTTSRNEQAKRHRQRMLVRVAEVVASEELSARPGECVPLPEVITPLDWESIPAALDPAAEFTEGTRSVRAPFQKTGSLSAERGLRKRQQCESYLRVLEPLVRTMHAELGRSVHVVDFCAGSGNATLSVAWVLRDLAHFTFVEKYSIPSEICGARLTEAGLKGAAEMEKVESWEGAFDIGVATHCW